jgi:ribose 1,5-bisphosphokinase
MSALVQARPGLELVRRVITRDAGAGGEAFESVSDAEFLRREAIGAFLLSWGAHGLRYGIPEAIQAQRRGKPGVLVNLSRSVLLQAQDLFPGLVVVSLSADPEVLAQRLAHRGRENASDRARRLGRAANPLPDGLNHVIAVDNSGALEETVAQILAQLHLSESV